MTRYLPGDIVRVRNARNKIGVYQIASDNEWFYKVYVLKFVDLPLVGSTMFPEMKMPPKTFLRKAEANPELYKEVTFERKYLTTKAAHNVIGKLPIGPEQVLY